MDFVFLLPYLRKGNGLMDIRIVGIGDIMTCLQDNLSILEVKKV
jgi:hypothetical protein